MVEQFYPSVTELVRLQRTRRAMVTTLLVATVVIVFGTIGAFLLFTNVSGPIAWLLGLVAFVSIALPVIIWHNPRAGFYLLFFAAITFGGSPGKYFDAIVPTTLVPIWWNISIIGQTFGIKALNGISVSPAELIMLLTTATWLVRAIVKHELTFRRGPLLGCVLCYVAMVTFGLVNGIARGGDRTIALWEVRTQFHLLLVFMLAANLITELKHVKTLLWIVIGCASLQSVLGMIKYISLGGVVADDGLMMHDEAFMLNVAFFIFLIMAVVRPDKKLTIGACLAAPLVAGGILVNNRRGGIGAAVVAFLPLIPLLWTLFEERRSQIMGFGVAVVLVSAIYFPIAWNGAGPWALPARALRSQSDPNQRDSASNNYRYAEDYDLKTTRDLMPWTGIGYGRPFSQPRPLPTIYFPLKDYLPHDGILWVWMRTGHFGFLAFMMMIFVVIIRGIQSLKTVENPVLKAIGVLAISDVVMLYIYSKYDMQLISPRTIFVSATMMGVLSAIHFIKAPETSESRPDSAVDPSVFAS